LDWDDDVEMTLVGDRAPLLGPTRRNLAHIVVLQGRQLGETFKIEGSVVLGRGSDADVRINDDEISRRHVRVEQRGDSVWIEDLGSRNGTFVNGERIVNTELKDGDKIQLGATTILKFTYHDDLEAEFQKRMYDAALRDPLTKIFNRRHFLERLSIEIAYAKRHSSPVSLVILDIDHFKNVNDQHGHPAGDHVLVKLAEDIGGQLRAEDIFARYGGEEFVILLRGVEPEKAAMLAERLRHRIASLALEHGGKKLAVTISLGVAALPGPKVDDGDTLVRAADQALYKAKNAGRNRVVLHKA